MKKHILRRNILDSKSKYSENDTIKMLQFLVDNIFAGKVFQKWSVFQWAQIAPSSWRHTSLLIWNRIYTVLALSGKENIGISVQFNIQLHFFYIDVVLSINNPEFEKCLGQIYPVELEIKDTTESDASASDLDLLLSIGRNGQLHTSIYDNRDDFQFLYHKLSFPG